MIRSLRLSATLLSRSKLAYSTSSTSATTLTFFTRQGCKLCSDAKDVLDNSLQKSSSLLSPNFRLDLRIIDIDEPANQEWFDKYCYDVPVLHVEASDQKLKKFMHYLNEDELIQVFKTSASEQDRDNLVSR
ncbi:uncharacterized protein LODBEIA_P22670 [Lodderomyces beijingensis]|uniref:Glutaredoxin-like protein n=1 Tax=Lodderomyces beijingensis TaxID=1775926 RepID=A0ABP0ZK82_9ASCO